jgi:hypothetical protein
MPLQAKTGSADAHPIEHRECDYLGSSTSLTLLLARIDAAGTSALFSSRSEAVQRFAISIWVKRLVKWQG